MDWIEIGKVAAPALVGAFSAILSAVLTNVYAERRHNREMVAKDRETRQRTLESMLPLRLEAYRNVFRMLQDIQSERKLTMQAYDELVPELLWISPDFAREVLALLRQVVSEGETRENMSAQVAALQGKLRNLVGAAELDLLFSSRDDE